MQITEITNGKIESCFLCKSCGEEFMGKKKPRKTELDLSYIKTPEDLLEFIQGTQKESFPPCKCGLTLEDFDEHGRFGCPHCYDHFEQRMEQLVYPYHKGKKQHVGKRPKRQMEEEAKKPSEKLKLLKLRYAKALELEEYEKLSNLLEEIDDIKTLLSITFEGQ